MKTYEQYMKKKEDNINILRPAKKFKSGSNLGSMFGGYATTALSQAPNFINNPNAPKTSTVQDLGRQVGNQALNSVVPGLGSIAQIGQGFADKLGKEECDPITGECADYSSGAANLGKQVLDPIGSTIGMGEKLLSGNFQGALASSPIGMLFGVKDEKNEKMKRELEYRAKKRKENEYTVAQNKVNAQNLVQQQNKYKTMGDNFGYMKIGGMLSIVKYQDGGELLFSKGTAEKWPELAHLVEVGEILYRNAKKTGDPEDMRRAMQVFDNHLRLRGKEASEKPFVKKTVPVYTIPELDRSLKIPKPNLQLQDIYDSDQERFIQERDSNGTGFNNIVEKRNRQGIINKKQLGTTNIGKPNTDWKNLPNKKDGGLLKYQNGELLNALKGKYNPKKSYLEDQIELQRPTNTKKYVDEELDFDQTIKSLGKYVTGKEEMLPEEFSESMIEKYPDLVDKLDKGNFEDKDVNLLKKKYDMFYKVKPKQKLAVYNGKRVIN